MKGARLERECPAPTTRAVNSRCNGAELRSRRRRCRSTSTRGAPCGGNTPMPLNDNVERRRVDVACRRRRPATGTRASSTSPRKTSVRCAWSGRTHFSGAAAGPERRRDPLLLRRHRRPASRSTGRRRRTAARYLRSDHSRASGLPQHHQPHHVERRLRRLKLHHLAAADELKRPDADLVVDDHGNRDGADRLLRRAAARAGDAGDADADVACRRARMPSAIARATGSLTAPCSAISASGTPASSVFDAIAVADDAAVDVVGAAGHVGQPRRQQPAGARLGRRRSSSGARAADRRRPLRATRPSAL